MVCFNGIKKTTSKPMQTNAIANYKIASGNSEELLAVVIDSEVTFAKHIENLESSQIYDFRKAPLSYENICFFPI